MAVLNHQMVIVTGQTFINPKSETNPTNRCFFMFFPVEQGARIIPFQSVSIVENEQYVATNQIINHRKQCWITHSWATSTCWNPQTTIFGSYINHHLWWWNQHLFVVKSAFVHVKSAFVHGSISICSWFNQHLFMVQSHLFMVKSAFVHGWINICSWFNHICSWFNHIFAWINQHLFMVQSQLFRVKSAFVHG